MSGFETAVVAAIVLGAATYLLRRSLRTLAGRSCGCGPASEKGCPAAGTLAEDLERLAREADAEGSGQGLSENPVVGTMPGRVLGQTLGAGGADPRR